MFILIFRWFIRINRATNANQYFFFFWLHKPGLPKHGISPVITYAFWRVAILITCLARAKSLVNNTVVMMLHFLMKHGQKNLKHAQKGRGDCSLRKKPLAFLLKQLFYPFMPVTAHLHFL